MISLTNECIASINKIDDCILEAQIEVGHSMLGAYIKHSKLMMEQSEYIQEANSFWTPQREDGESIFKTIFLFIPRLIVALFQGLKNKWREIKFKFMTPDQKELVRISELSYAERLVEIIDDPRFTCKGKKGEECTFYFKTKIADFDKLIDYYMTTCGIFKAYLHFIDEDDINSAFEKLSEMTIDNNIYQFSSVFLGHLVEKEYEMETTPEMIMNFGKFHKKILDDIKKVMDTIQKWYNTHAKKSANTLFHKDYYRSATRFIDALNKSYEDMAKNDIKVLDEINELTNLIYKISDVSHKVYMSSKDEK